jgi:hypothetical protein
MKNKLNILPRAVFVALMAFTISACSSYERFPGQNQIAENKARAAEELDKEIPMLGVATTCFRHENTSYISAFFVQEPFSSNMEGGGGCGGLIAGGYRLPRKWQAGMKVKVRWKPNGREWIEKYTTILPYDKPGVLYVHFFEHDQVRVVSSAYAGALSPNHPIHQDVVTPPPEAE